MIQNRKYKLAIIYEASLLLVLAGVILAGKLDAVLFGAWLAGYATGFVTYVLGNVAVANAPAAQVTKVETKTETKSEASTIGVPG